MKLQIIPIIFQKKLKFLLLIQMIHYICKTNQKNKNIEEGGFNIKKVALIDSISTTTKDQFEMFKKYMLILKNIDGVNKKKS